MEVIPGGIQDTVLSQVHVTQLLKNHPKSLSNIQSS